MTNREIIVCQGAAELNRRATEQFIELTAEAIKQRGRFAVALSGGSTPRALYELLASRAFSSRMAWSQVHLFWGDERCVTPDHPDSNYRMVREALLDKIEVPAANVHRIAGEKPPAAGAADYEAQLRNFFSGSENKLPRFDLVLLGLGEDGHTASLFPGNVALTESERWVAPSYIEKLQAHRLTLTFAVLNNAAQITFLVAGESKAAIVKEIFTHEDSDLPAARIRPAAGNLTWLLTKEAAGEINDRQRP